MASSVPHSATVPPPLHSPHSPYTKSRPSAFGSCFDDYDDAVSRRPSSQQHSQMRSRADGDRTEVDPSSFARWSVHSSQPTTPCAETQTSGFGRGTKSNTSTPALDTPPCLGKTKDARLACRQTRESAYAAATTEGSEGSGHPQKKELRIEECVANVCTMNRAAFSPASVLSATTKSMDTACTGGRDSSIFSFTSSVPDAFLASLPVTNCGSCGNNANANLFGRRQPTSMATSPQLNTNASPLLTLPIPAPPGGGIATVVDASSGERSVDHPAVNECSTSASQLSKCKRRLQGLNRPAFDLKAVEEAQGTFLEEEQVCNAAQCYPLSEITPLLCVGTWKDAANPALLRRLGIRYVLNVARELDPAAEANVIAHNKDLIYESIPMSDCHSQDVGAHLHQAFAFIEKARAAGERVLVHCRRGISRSPAIVVGYLMASEHRSYEDALRFVTARRGCVSLNLAFQERLSEYVPTSEFFHGPPPPSPLTVAQLSGPSAGVLPSLSIAPTRSEHGGGGSFRQPAQSSGAAPQRRDDDATPLPPPCGTFSANSSAASSRASSALRQNVSLTGVPSTTPNFARAPHRPRVALHHQKSSTVGGSSFANTPKSLATTASPTSTDSGVVTVIPVSAAAAVDKTRWLEEPVAPSGAASTQASSLFTADAVWSGKKTPLSVRKATAVRPLLTGNGGRTFADFGSRSSSSATSTSSESDATHTRGDDAQDSSEAEEPGSPFGVGNRRAFAHFNFSPPSSSSNNVSPATKKGTRSFSEEEGENSTTLAHPSSPAQRSSGGGSGKGADASRRRQKDVWTDEEDTHGREEDGGPAFEMRLPRPPHRSPAQRSAFDDLADDEGGDDDDANEGVGGSTVVDLGDLRKTRPGALPGRLARLTRSAGAQMSGPALHTSPPVRMASTSIAKEPSRPRTQSPIRAAEDSGSSMSHGNTTGTVGGFSTTPYGTQGSLNDETAQSGVRVVSHTSSLSG